jgi:hypothetical protein
MSTDPEDFFDDNAASKQARTPRQKIRVLGPHFGSKVRKLAGSSSRAGSKNRARGKQDSKKQQLAELLVAPVRHAADQIGLDVSVSGDRFWLLWALAWAVYGAKRPGRANKWLSDSYKQLLADCASVKEQKPALTEAAICKQLVSGPLKLERYAQFEPKTILRQLQEAKKRRSGDQKFIDDFVQAE